MAKKKAEKPKREFTKQQLSRWQQQKKRQRIILGVGITIIVAVVVTVITGWYSNHYKPLHETVIKVNNTKFDMNYYVKTLKLYGEGLPSNYIYYLADSVVKDIEENELVRQAAEKLGIAVSDDAVYEELKSRNPPLSEDYKDLMRAEMLKEKLRDEYFDPEVPQFAEQRHIMAMFMESESQAAEVRAKLEAGEDFAQLAKELSLESLSKEKEGDFGWRPKDALTILLNTSLLDEYAFGAEIGVLSPPIYDEARAKNVGYWIVKISERKEDSGEVHVHGMLLGSAEEAKSVKARLEAGEDFAELAGELSQNDSSKINNGDLGWLPEGMIPAIDDFVYNPELEVEKLSEPIRDDTATTQGGYWLVKVSEIDGNRQIDDENRNLLKTKVFDEWVASLWDNSENKVDHSYLTQERKAWAIQKAMES